MELDRKVVLGLLDKMGAAYTDKISNERAVMKLQRYLEKVGTPKDATAEEVKLIDGLKKAPAPKEESPAKEEKAEKPEVVLSKDKKVKKEPKAKIPTRRTWMGISAKAVMSSKTVEDAEAKALEAYVAERGKKTESMEKWGKVCVHYAILVLVEVGVISIKDDNNTIIKNK